MADPQYRKRPVVIEAVRYDGPTKKSLDVVAAFAGDDWLQTVSPNPPGDDLVIDTLEGEMRANPGDWIIRGVKGELYPCKPDIFEATYEAVSYADAIAKSARLKTYREEEHELIDACRMGHGTMYGQDDLADVVAALAVECEYREQNERVEMRRADEYQAAYRAAEAERDALAAELASVRAQLDEMRDEKETR